MGDPRKQKKQYQGPMHPWQSDRLEEEKKLVKEYGLKNKTEVWKHASEAKRIIETFKKTGVVASEQSTKERQQIVNRMIRLNLTHKGASDDEVLGLGIQGILERRLQTQVVRKKLARTMKQARQFIVHRHITVNGTVITSPGYIVTADDENKLGFVVRSSLFDEEHPERADPKKVAEELKNKKKAEKEAAEARKAQEEATKQKEAEAAKVAEEKPVEKVKEEKKDE